MHESAWSMHATTHNEKGSTQESSLTLFAFAFGNLRLIGEQIEFHRFDARVLAKANVFRDVFLHGRNVQQQNL